MPTSTPSPTRLTKSRTALIALGCAVGLALAFVPAMPAADSSVALQPLADKALPLTPTFEKTTGKEGPPYVLHLKNDSKAAVTVTAKILLSVAFHANDKAKHLPAQAIEAGKTWSIADLAANDKVVLTADGFAPLELTVP